MAFQEKHLQIRKSKLPGAGKGLFTREFIAKGTRITEYKGRSQKWKVVKDQDGYNGYLMYINRNVVINGEKSLKTWARYANDAKGLTKVEGLRNNAEYISEGPRCFLDALRDIQPGEEILAGYGREYWVLIRKIRRERA
jgi:SET domain-containing protein